MIIFILIVMVAVGITNYAVNYYYWNHGRCRCGGTWTNPRHEFMLGFVWVCDRCGETTEHWPPIRSL